MNRVIARSWLMALVFALIAHPAFAQGGATSSISGVVVLRICGCIYEEIGGVRVNRKSQSNCHCQQRSFAESFMPFIRPLKKHVSA